jgi:hypothetical protein
MDDEPFLLTRGFDMFYPEVGNKGKFAVALSTKMSMDTSYHYNFRGFSLSLQST